MSGEPANFTFEEAARWRARRYKSAAGPRPTLGDLQRATPWVWMHCERCQHHAPLACAIAVIRWGADESSDKSRNCARCTALRRQRRRHPTSRLGRRTHRLSAVPDRILTPQPFRSAFFAAPFSAAWSLPGTNRFATELPLKGRAGNFGHGEIHVAL
jgi:hypothetical protein